MTYNRPWKSFSEQLTLLESRGIKVTDRSAALSYLERIGYYRLSAYWYPFRVFNIEQCPKTKKLLTIRGDNFVSNTHFVDAVELYLFDKKLRLFVIDAMERIEIALRVDIAYHLGKRNTFAYLDKNEFHPSFANKAKGKGNKTEFEKWQEKYGALLSRSKEDFVKHYLTNHGQHLPIWVAVEVWDFGVLSKLFSLMRVSDQQEIASKYGVDDWRVFQSWLRALNYLRNLAAHHSRLWNRNVIDQPKLPSTKGTISWCDDFIGKDDLISKPFLLLAIARHMIKVICPNTSWNSRVNEHLFAFPQQLSDRKLSIRDMGIPQGWDTWW